MVEVATVNRIIATLRQYIGELRRLQSLPVREIASDVRIQWAVRYGLLVAIQCIIDIGNHLLAAQETVEAPTSDEEVIVGLGRTSVIPKSFAKRIRKMAGFGNLLVHHYAEVKPRMGATKLKERLDDFEKFIDYIENYLGRIKGHEKYNRRSKTR